MSRFQVTALLMVISLNSLSAIAQTPATLTSTYDNLLRDLETSSLYSNGLVLRSEKITRPIFTGFPNGGFKTTKGITIRGFAGDLKESRGQTFIAVGEDDHVYSSQSRVLNRCVPADTYHPNTTDTNKCYKVKEGDFIPGIHGYQL